MKLLDLTFRWRGVRTRPCSNDTNNVQQLLVIQPEYKTGPVQYPYVSAAHKLEEAVSLVNAITGWGVYQQRVDAVRKVHSQHFFGKGKMAELKAEVRSLREKLTGVFINTPLLSPPQHRTLERVFKKKVYDRFGIVLQLFKERAQTKEAKVQVEIAEIPFMLTRLYGGVGEGAGIKGETPIEVRRFRMNRRLKHLQKELQEIRDNKKKLRESRVRRFSIPTVAVVGYTNAGKTTLIKSLSDSTSLVPRDMLFATLDSTLHHGKLPSGFPVLYVDTIGFIVDLPVALVESFSSTLEDSIKAVRRSP